MSNIEKIKAEIERRKKICTDIFERQSDTYYQGKAVAYGELLPFIDSLPDENNPEPYNPAGIKIKPGLNGMRIDTTKFGFLSKQPRESLIDPYIESMRRQIERKIADLPPAPEGYRYSWKLEDFSKEGDSVSITSNIVLKPIDPEK